MAGTTVTEHVQGRRKEVVGEVVSSRMHKTIVVQVTRKKSHPFYGRVIARHKKFYAHDEKNQAHVGDVVRLRASLEPHLRGSTRAMVIWPKLTG